jgi:hypothetical protein
MGFDLLGKTHTTYTEIARHASQLVDLTQCERVEVWKTQIGNARIEYCFALERGGFGALDRAHNIDHFEKLCPQTGFD